jgi:hypothetical protein
MFPHLEILDLVVMPHGLDGKMLKQLELSAQHYMEPEQHQLHLEIVG